MMTTRDIRAILVYLFKSGESAAAANKKINDVFGEGTSSERTARRWFAKFREGDFNLDNEPRGRPERLLNDESLKALVEENPRTTCVELAEHFEVHPSTISRHLAAINKVKKLDKWIPHELSEANKLRRLEVSTSLLLRENREPFLERLVTCDEKWVLYNNTKRSGQWVDADDRPGQAARPERHERKIMLTVWWTIKGLVHYRFLPDGETIDANSYCRDIAEMHAKLTRLQPALVNRRGPILLHDNAKPHIARTTISKLNDLGYEILPHPPYSPDLSPTDFHLFRSLGNYLTNLRFQDRNSIENAFKDFVASRNKDFWKKGIYDLKHRWQQCINCNGDYFDE